MATALIKTLGIEMNGKCMAFRNMVATLMVQWFASLQK